MSAPSGNTSITRRFALFPSREAPSVQIALSSGQARCTGRRPHHNHCIYPCSPRRVGSNGATKHAHPLREAHKRPSQSWPLRTPMLLPRSRSGESRLQRPSTKNGGALEHCRTQPSNAAHADVMATTQSLRPSRPPYFSWGQTGRVSCTGLAELAERDMERHTEGRDTRL